MSFFPQPRVVDPRNRRLTAGLRLAHGEVRPGVARSVLGVAPKPVEAIAALMPQQLDMTASRHGNALRLRCQEDGEFWPRLVVAARNGDKKRLAEIHFHPKRLPYGHLMHPPS